MLRFLTAIILVGSAFSCAFAESIIKPIISEASVSLPRSKMVTIEDTETARKYTLFVQLPKAITHLLQGLPRNIHNRCALQFSYYRRLYANASKRRL